MAQALIELAENGLLRARLGPAARLRVIENFDLTRALIRYEEAWTSLIVSPAERPSPPTVRSDC